MTIAYNRFNSIRAKLKDIDKTCWELTLSALNIVKAKDGGYNYVCQECGKKSSYDEGYDKYISLWNFNVSKGSMIVYGIGDNMKISFCSLKCFIKYINKRANKIVKEAQKAHEDFIKYRKEAMDRGEIVW